MTRSKPNRAARPADSYRGARRAAVKAAAKVKKVKFRTLWPSPAKPPVEPPHNVVNTSDHPGANPLHDPAGRRRWMAKVLNPATGKLESVKMRGPRNPSRWVPHSSNREAERRLRQADGRAHG